MLRGRLDQTAILALIVRNVALANDKRCGLYHFAADLLKRSCAEVCHIDNIDCQQLCTQLLKAGQEHPSVLCDHRLIAVLLRHLPAAFDEHGKHIRLAVREVLLHIVVDLCPGVADSHIRRIRHYHIVLLRHNLRHLNQRQEAVQHALSEHTDVSPHFLHSGIEGGKAHLRDIQDRTVFLCIPQLVHQRSKVLLELRIIVGEVVNGAVVQSVTLDDSKHTRLNATGEDAAVILPCLHHDSKIGKLRRTVINI